MTDDPWGAISALFLSVVELPPRERRAFLERACAGSPGLCEEVLALLAEDEEATRERYLEPPFPAELPAEAPAGLASHPRYRILGRLGEGGMGVVYLAEHRFMRRLVALKVMRGDLIAVRGLGARFRREIRAAARLSSPNLVTAFDAEKVGRSHILVMEYVEGTDLARWVEENGPMPAVEACDAIRQAAAGLHHAFERGMTHRDLKPQNIMRTPEGRIKVLDFGIARFAAEAPPDPASGASLGTADYMAPEQVADPRSADTRSDIYSLGCTLYALLAGRPPFAAIPVPEKYAAHARGVPEPIPEIPAELETILARMMAKAPADRYQTPIEVARALDGWGDGPAAGRRAPARSRAALAAILALLLASAFGIALAVRREVDPSGQEAVVAEILALGGHVLRDEGRPDRPVIEVDLSNTRASDASMVGIGRLRGLRLLNLLGTRVGDEGIGHLARLPRLRVLNLCKTSAADAGLERLGEMASLECLFVEGPRFGKDGLRWLDRFKNMEDLDLAATSISDADLFRVGKAAKLRRLGLYGTSVTDAGLAHLEGLPSLSYLNVQKTRLSNEGLDRFGRRLPLVEILR